MRLKQIILLAALWIAVLPVPRAEGVLPTVKGGDIVILYDSDVHCAIDGYAKIAALRNAILRYSVNTLTVSCGDFASGSALGSYSRGDYIVRIMNAAGYDYTTLGNHEFDNGVPRVMHYDSLFRADIICCNFMSAATNRPVFKSYDIREIGGRKIAFVGVTTPHTPSSTSPLYYKAADGTNLYTFCADSIYSIVQRNVDLVRSLGAQTVILLSHMGDKEPTPNVLDLITRTDGIDIVLDGHSHSTIERRIVKNSKNADVLLTSTGTAFKNIGCLVIGGDGSFSSHLIPTADLTDADPSVADTVAAIRAAYDFIGSIVVGYSDATLPDVDDNGDRLTYVKETALGNICTEAFRAVMQADIAICNGGGIRNGIRQGPITKSDIYTLFPFRNKMVVARVSGQEILDLLEAASATLPLASGRFALVAGLRYTVNTSMPSNAVFDVDDVFTSVNGARRVSNVLFYNRNNNTYEPLDPSRAYTFATTDYVFSLMGCGYRFKDSGNAQISNLNDAETLIRYIADYKDGFLYRSAEITDGRIYFAK